MWLSRELSLSSKEKSETSIGETIGTDGSKIYIQSHQEYRDVPMIAPFGIAYNPPLNSEAVVLPTDKGNVCPGVICSNKNLKPGELMLYSSGGASIVLKDNGDVLINGKKVE